MMDIRLDYSVAAGYKSKRQIARVVTEHWVKRNMFCPICGEPILTHYRDNRPVADFFCNSCGSDYELKSKESTSGVGKKIADGALTTMMKRIQDLNNPNLFIMTHSHLKVKDFLLVPKYFFVPSIIEPREPLKPPARRAGWQGCNILYQDIPESGKIFIIKDYKTIDKQTVITNYNRTVELKTDNLESRGWVLDVLSCVDRAPQDNFTLQQIYEFAGELQSKHPDNNFVHAKIRQQLQILRDKGFIEFKARGQYKRIRL